MLSRLISRLTHGRQQSYTETAVKDFIREGRLDAAAVAASQLHASTPQRDATRHSLLGNIAYLQHQDETAESHYRQALVIAANNPDAHLGLSKILADNLQLNSALEHAQFAKNLRPEDADILAQLGYCHMLLDAYSSAEGFLRKALLHNPKDKRSWNNLAITLRSRGEVGQAKACWLQALEIDPDFKTALENMALLDGELAEADVQITIQRSTLANASRGLRIADSALPWPQIDALAREGQLDAAINLAERSLPEHPTEEEALGINDLYRQAGDWLTATGYLQAYLADHSESAQIWRALGDVHLAREQHQQALAAFRKARDLGLNDADLHADMSSTFHALERYQEALTHIRLACELDNSTKYKKRLAATLVMCCEYEEAARLYEELSASDNSVPQANHAMCLGYLGRLDESLAILDTIIRKEQQDPAVRMIRGQFRLLRGDWAGGWLDYAWRNFNQTKDFRMLPYSRWQGESLENKTIVILAEQGLGDQIMFASCLPDLIDLSPSTIILEAHERVAVTLARSFPGITIVPTRQKKDLGWVQKIGYADYFVSLGDLPQYFRQTDTAFPRKPFLQADPKKVSVWRKRLEKSGPRPWIGFSWRGGTEVTRTRLRTMDITDFAHLAHGTVGTWISLQYGPVQDTLDNAKKMAFHPVHWPEAITDLDEFAALISALDLVVTVCNTTVHYAGALGCPTIVLAPKLPEWRYQIHAQFMPWYPDVEVLRQPKDGDWASVVMHAAPRIIERTQNCHRLSPQDSR